MSGTLDGPGLTLAAGIPACILLGATFAGLDAAIAEVGEVRARAVRDAGKTFAKTAARLIDHEHVIRSRLLAWRVVTLCGAAVLASHVVPTDDWLAIVAATLGVAVSYSILVEIGTTFARKWTARITLPALFWLRPVEMVIVPLAAPLAWLGRLVERVLPAPREENAAKIVDLEVENVIEHAEAEGAIKKDHAALLRSVLEFKDTLVRTIMVPRTQVAAIEESMDAARVLELASDTGHSRYPVYREKLDHVVGVLYAKDLFRLARERGGSLVGEKITSLLRQPVLLVAETQKIGDVLTQMQTRREHLAVVVDEYGGTAGIVTLEDVIEEIVGDIRDEHDDGDPDVKQLAPDRYLVDATMSIYDLEKTLGVELPEDDGGYESVGGLLLERSGHVPVQNERVVVGDLEFVVRDADRKRVRRVEVIRRPRSTTGEAAAE